MIKDLLISAVTVASSISFSFYRMEGPFYSTDFPKINPLWALPNDPELTTVFLYDKNTYLTLEYTFIDNQGDIDKHPFYILSNPLFKKITNLVFISEDVITPSKFLNCSFKYDNTFWDFGKFMSAYKVQDYLHGDYFDWSYYSVSRQKIRSLNKDHASIFNIHSSFISKSGVKINNADTKVVLNFKGVNIHLEKSLQSYFQTENSYTNFAKAWGEYQTFIRTSSNSKNNDKYFIKYIEPKLQRLGNPTLSDESFKLLNESEILAVWCLVPNIIDGKEVESQLIGLAQDKDGKLFHWVTDLKNDVSVLFPKQKKAMTKALDKPWSLFSKIKDIISLILETNG